MTWMDWVLTGFLALLVLFLLFVAIAAIVYGEVGDS